MPSEQRGDHAPAQPLHSAVNTVHLFTAQPDQVAVPLAEAARLLDTTPTALRMRVKRHRLAGEERDGQWYVFLVPGEHRGAHPAAPPAEQGALAGEQRSATDQHDLHEPVAALIAQLRSDVAALTAALERRDRDVEREHTAQTELRATLERELERAAVERAELRRLLAAATQPRLPAPVDTVATQPEAAENGSAAVESVLRGVSTPWWAFWRR